MGGSASRRKQSTWCRQRGASRRKKELFLNALWEVEFARVKSFRRPEQRLTQKLTSSRATSTVSRFRFSRSLARRKLRGRMPTSGCRRTLLTARMLYRILDNTTYNCIRLSAVFSRNSFSSSRQTVLSTLWFRKRGEFPLFAKIEVRKECFVTSI